MSSTVKRNLQSMRKFKDKSREWFNSKSDVITLKLERLMMVCNGYNKIQPVRLSRGVSTMLPDASLVGAQGQCQFRPCLGSRKMRRSAPNKPRHDFVRLPKPEDQVSAAKTRTTFCSTDALRWGSDLSQLEPSKRLSSTAAVQVATKSITLVDPAINTPNVRRSDNNRRNDVQFCCDCGCMIEMINGEFERVEQRLAQPHRQRKRMLSRQYSAPAKCR